MAAPIVGENSIGACLAWRSFQSAILGIIAYLVTQGRVWPNVTLNKLRARDELRRVVGFSVADEITKLDQLEKSGSITDAEYASLRAKLV